MAKVNGIDLVFKKIPETTHKALIDGDEVIPFAGLDGTFYYITRDELFSQMGGFTSGFNGEIALADIPSEDGMYIPSQSGTYVNAGGVVVDLSAGITFIIKTGSAFETVVYPVDMAVTGLVEPADENAVPGGEVAGVFDSAVGIDFIPPNTSDPLAPLRGVDRTDLDTNPDWGWGYYTTIGTVASSVTLWMHNKAFIPLQAGLYEFDLYLQPGRCVILYDETETMIGFIQGPSGLPPEQAKVQFEMPVDGFFRMSYPTTIDDDPNVPSLEARTFKSVQKIVPSERVFKLAANFDSDVRGILEADYAIENMPADTEFISELIGSDVGDTSLWSGGFLREDGTTQNGANWYHTVKFYRLPKGTYKFQFYFSGNARAIIYNLEGVQQSTLSKAGSLDSFAGEFTIAEDSLIRFSHREAVGEDRIDNITIKSKDPLVPSIITSFNVREYAGSSASIRQVYLDTYRPRRKRPVLTIIADDGHVRNEEWFKGILDEYNVKATLAIIGSRVVEADAGTNANYLTSAKLKQFYEEGHDLASHTWTHTHTMAEQTLDEIDDELSRNKIFVEKLTDTPCNMFISPYGVRSPAIDNIVARYYDANFISGYAIENPLPLDNFFINRVSFDGSEDTFELIFNSTLKPAIDTAIANDEWLVLAVHPQYQQYKEGTNPSALDRQDELRQVIEYCQTNGVEITTAKKAYEYFKNHVNIGVRRVDDRYYQLGADMSELNVNYFED